MPYIAVLSPLFGFLIVGFLGRFLSNRASALITTGLMACACLAAWSLFPDVVFKGHNIDLILFKWIDVAYFQVSWGIHLDSLCLIMVCVVTTVSFVVHLYSIGYMEHDAGIARFMAFLSLFTFMMLMLVTSSNLIQLFFGWEGVGLASYLLIGFWYHKPSANAAAIKAFVVNRVGDLGLVLGIGLLYSLFGSVDIQTIVSTCGQYTQDEILLGSFSFNALEVAALLLFVGAMGKSAQLGLHTWLPDAMEGPTPVSALIHAATMVTAGVFLIARLSPLYELAPYARMVVTVVGASTAFFAGTIALTQNDIKRVIAYSTCSQLGYMFFAAGVSAYGVSIFHLATHAFFKALLFLGAGAVIHALSDEQDLRKMGGIWRAVPVSCAMMWIGSLALAGMPFFAGYYSKDAILAAAWGAGTDVGFYAFWMGIIAAFMTALYSWRLLYLAFAGTPRADEKVMGHLHEAGYTMLVPLLILSIGAIFSGYIGHHYIGEKSFWGDSLVLLPQAHLPGLLHYLPAFVGVLGILLATLLYLKKSQWLTTLVETFPKLHAFLLNKWYVDELYERLFIKPALALGQFFWSKSDAQLIDKGAVGGLAHWALGMAARTSQFQTGLITQYMLVMLLGVGAVVGLVFMMESV